MSPILSSDAAGTSHAFGDQQIPRSASEVASQRAQGRYTTSITDSTILMLPATPTAGNVLVVFVSNNNALQTATVTYGGTTATSVTGYFNTGICGYMFYVVLNSTNIASGGRNVRVQWTSGGTAAGWAVTELSGVDTSSTIDKATANTGATGSSVAFIVCAPLTSTIHSYKAGIGIAFGTCAGAQTLSSATYSGDDMTTTSTGSTGSLANSCNVVTLAVNKARTFTCTTQSNTVAFLLSGATSRNYVGVYAYFKAAA